MGVNWSEEYSCGHADIDHDHKHIFIMINMYELAILKKNVTGLELVFEDLMRFTKQHFKQEEDFMFEMDYSDMDHHVKSHIGLIQELEKFHHENLSEKKLRPHHAQHFLKHWFVDHIMTEDMKFKEHMKVIQKSKRHPIVDEPYCDNAADSISR